MTTGGAVTLCPVCGSERTHAFDAVVLRRHSAEFVLCQGCGLLQAHAPYWLEEAYGSALSDIDTGLVARNQRVAQALNGIYGQWFDPTDRFVDLAGGSGLLVRMLRDLGYDAYWDDPYAANLFARGFEAAGRGPFRAGSAVEVLEHVEDPLDFVRRAFDDWGVEALVFTQELYAGDPPPQDWWYYQLETGQHISFYERRTLERIAEAVGCTVLSSRWLHVLVRRDADVARWPVRLADSGRLRPWLSRWASRRSQPRTAADSELMKRSL